MRFAWLFLLASCSLDRATAREETLLDKLRAKSNLYSSFHYKAELTDGKLVVPIELAWQAPDRALLRYGPNHTMIVSGGVNRTLERRNTSTFDYVAALGELQKTYGDLLPSPPQPAFSLGSWEMPLYGRGILATIDVRPLGARLGWLDDLASWLAEGHVYRKGAIEIELRDDGFIQRAKIASTAQFLLKELEIDRPLDNALFVLPAVEGSVDISDVRSPQRVQELEEAFRRWVLGARPDQARLEALVKIDLARAYEPPKLVEFQKKNLDDEIDAYRKQQPNALQLAVKEKIEIARGKAMGALEIMEQEIQKEFRRRLDHAFAPKAAPAVVADRWSAAVSRQIDLQIRRPLDQVFADRLKQ
jgi:hypothetical protein